MRSFVVLSALLAVGMCGVLPGGYNYNSGSSFNHGALIGPAFAGSNNVPQISSGIQAPAVSSGNYGSASVAQPTYSGNGVSGVTGGFTSGPSGNNGFTSGPSGNNGFTSGPSGNFASPSVGHPAVSAPSGNGFTSGPSGNGFTSGPSGNNGFTSGPSGNFGNTGSPSVAAPAFVGHVDEAPRHEAPLVTKQFYLHSAPEDHDSVGKTKHFVLGRAQKNYRVVFIKAPSDSNANVRLSAEYAPQEEKTVIYVLSQKEHELDVNDIATPAPTQPSKPEVFFIKYKTPEEAAHAQQEIQNQYDILGGQSQVSDEGVAPVSDVSGALSPAPAASERQNGPGYLPPAASQNYLPPQH